MPDQTTPPAAPEGNFDVRDALARHFRPRAFGEPWPSPERQEHEQRFAFGEADALLAAFEVRPRGTATDAEADSRLRAVLAGYLDLRTVARVMAELEITREVRNVAHRYRV